MTKVGFFLDKLVSMCDSKDVEIVVLEYIENNIQENEQMLQSQLAFVKRNSSHFHLNLFMPLSVGKAIMQNNGINADMHAFYEHISQILSDAIIYTYNVMNYRSYLKKYDKKIPVCNGINCDHENLYKVLFKVKGQDAYLYFTIDELHFFL